MCLKHFQFWNIPRSYFLYGLYTQPKYLQKYLGCWAVSVFSLTQKVL